MTHGTEDVTKPLPGCSPDQRNCSVLLAVTMVEADLQVLQANGDDEAPLGFSRTMWTEPGFLRSQVHADDLPLIRRFAASAEPGGHQGVLQCRIYGADRRQRWIRIAVTGVDAHSNGRSLSAVITLISTETETQDGTAALLALKEEVLATVFTHLETTSRTMSGFAGMLERHLSIQADTIGSEYAVGIRGGLEKAHLLLHHLRPLARQRIVDTDECKAALSALNRAMDKTQ